MNLSRQSGRVVHSTTALVTRAQINTATSASDYAPDVPPDTWVRDTSGSRPDNYIRRPDGSKRPITSADVGKKYEEISATEPDPQLQGGWLRRNRLTLLVTAGVSVVALVLARRLLRLPRRPGTQPSGDPSPTA